MNKLEKITVTIRHLPFLEKMTGLWNAVRPIYNALYAFFGYKGLVRVINGSDRLRLCHLMRSAATTYEPEVWARLMSHVQPGDRFVDVGAYAGIYSLAVAAFMRFCARAARAASVPPVPSCPPA